MPRLTLRAQLIRGLERLGYHRAPYSLSKYEIFIDHVRPGRNIYVGRQHALRGGRTLSESIPLDGLKRQALNAGLPERWCGEGGV